MTKLEYTIYEIKCNDEDKEFIYIGSTKNFNRRKKQHELYSINEKNNYLLYKFIRENQGWANFQMKIIEIIVCETKTDARIREQFWLENKKANLNNRNAYSTKEFIKEQNKEKAKQYYEKNKEKAKQYQKQYYEKNKLNQKKIKIKKNLNQKTKNLKIFSKI